MRNGEAPASPSLRANGSRKRGPMVRTRNPELVPYFEIPGSLAEGLAPRNDGVDGPPLHPPSACHSIMSHPLSSILQLRISCNYSCKWDAFGPVVQTNRPNRLFPGISKG